MKNNHALEYKMTRKMFNAILSKRTEAEKKLNPYKYVMGVINEEWGLKGTVKNILISGE